MVMRPKGTLGQALSASARADASAGRRYGTVMSVGAGTVDVLPDGGTALWQRIRTTGSPVVGMRVELQRVGDTYTAIAPPGEASSSRGAGLVILPSPGVTGGGSGGTAYPLPHASSHATAGPDPLTPAAIGAAVAGDITTALTNHTAASNPHAQYLLLAGGNMAGTLNPQHMIPLLTDTYDLGSTAKYWRKAYISEIDAVLFAKDVASVVGGYLIVPKNAGVLPADLTTGALTVDFGQAMTANDFVLFRAAGAVEYMQVGTLVSGATYNVTRNLDGSGANAWPAGTVYMVLGYNGTGRIEIDATTGTPVLSMKLAGATYNGDTIPLRIAPDGLSLAAKTSYSSPNSVSWTSADRATLYATLYDIADSGGNHLWLKSSEAASNRDAGIIINSVAGGTGGESLIRLAADSATSSSQVDIDADAGITFVFGDVIINHALTVAGILSTASDLKITGAAKRIIADFSHGTQAQRVAFQSSTANAGTNVPIIPNGTSLISAITCFNNSSVANCSQIQITSESTGTKMILRSGGIGSGASLPLVVEVGTGVEIIRFNPNDMTFAEAKDIIFGTTTGTKIGTGTTQKIGFYGVTPVTQPASANQAAAPAGGTGATAGAYDTAAHRDSLIALVNEMRTVLVNVGLMKGSA